MKFLKYFILLILAVIIGGYFYASSQPATFEVSRSKVIKAPVAKVFNMVNDLKTWEKWGPWHDEDSTIVITYGDKTVGVGASDSWTSKDGPGSMKTTKVETNKLIEQKLFFGSEIPTDIVWNFKEMANETELTWTMKQDNASLMLRGIAKVMGGWENFFGPMEEKGLNNIAKVINEMPNDFRISEVSNVNLEGEKFIGYPVKMKINHDDMTKAFMDHMPKAGMYAVNKGLKSTDYIPATVYTKYDEQTQETEFYIGLMLYKNVAPAKGMIALNLPKGKGVKVSKFGNYGNGDYEAHTAIANYLSTHKLEQLYPIWETYPNDPATVKPVDIQTDIYYPLK